MKPVLVRRLPSPAMAVALAALFMALGGTSYAVTQLPRNSVGTPQLKINAVTSAKVKNRSLMRVDFAPGQITGGGAAGGAGPAGPAGPAGSAGTGATLSMGWVSSAADVIHSSTVLTDLGSTSTFTVPAGTTATVVATFSAETSCTSVYCTVSLSIDGNEMAPTSGNDFAFDSHGGNQDGEAHSMTRVRAGIGPGDHAVKARIRINSPVGNFRVDDWALVGVAYEQG